MKTSQNELWNVQTRGGILKRKGIFDETRVLSHLKHPVFCYAIIIQSPQSSIRGGGATTDRTHTAIPHSNVIAVRFFLGRPETVPVRVKTDDRTGFRDRGRRSVSHVDHPETGHRIRDVSVIIIVVVGGSQQCGDVVAAAFIAGYSRDEIAVDVRRRRCRGRPERRKREDGQELIDQRLFVFGDGLRAVFGPAANVYWRCRCRRVAVDRTRRRALGQLLTAAGRRRSRAMEISHRPSVRRSVCRREILVAARSPLFR